jgi:hypothetical protein
MGNKMLEPKAVFRGVSGLIEAPHQVIIKSRKKSQNAFKKGGQRNGTSGT